MSKDELNKIKMVKLQIKNAIISQKWSFESIKYREEGTIYRYLNSINEDIDMKDASLRIDVTPSFKYNGIDGNSKVAIFLNSKSGWSNFNAMYYGFSKFELRILRWKLFFLSIKKEFLQYEYKKQRSIVELAKCSNKFIEENKNIFRDSKIEEIIGK